MSLRSSGTPVRRHLSFNSLPYRGRSFYLDIKAASVKNKLAQHIIELGGAVEGFLSKDLTLIVTDRGLDKHDSTTFEVKKPHQSQIPLSRGQALLKASQHQGPKDGHGQDFLQNATNLGIKTQTAAKFMQITTKTLSKIKSKQKDENDILEGMSTISWDKDKENLCLIKVEDDENVYRPLFKQLEVFPQVDYSQPGCPFDVGVVLTKEKEKNPAKKKSVGGVLRGGYCESCDHWYKCTLREHLKSDKHCSFVKSVDNYKSLDSLTTSLPNLNCFMGKYSLQCETGLDKQSNEEHAHGKSLENATEAAVKNDGKFGAVKNILQTSLGVNCYFSNFSTVSATDGWTEQELEKSELATGLNEKLCYSVSSKMHASDLNSTLSRSSCKTNTPACSDRKLTLNEVLKNVFDADNAVDGDFSCSEDEINIESNLQSNISAKHETKFPNVSESHSANKSSTEYSNDTNFKHSSSTQFVKSSDQNKFAAHCPSSTTDINASLSNLLQESNSLRHGPEATFSSSCSFGDNGVNNVLSFLQNNDSNSTQSSTVDKSHLTDNRGNIRTRTVSELSERSCISSNLSSSHQSLTHKAINNIVAANSEYYTSQSCSNVLDFKQKSKTFENENNGAFIPAVKVPAATNQESCSSSGALSAILGNSYSAQSSTTNYPGLSDIVNSETVVKSKYPLDVESDCASSHFQPNNSIQNDQISYSTLSTGQINVNGEITRTSLSVASTKHDISVDHDKTPIGKGTMRQPCLEDLCRSGSSIRNWLLPQDDDDGDNDNMSEKTTVSKLDHTLTEMKNSPVPAAAETDNQLNNELDIVTKDLSQTVESHACNLVANWIQKQTFHQTTGNEPPIGTVQSSGCEISLKSRPDENFTSSRDSVLTDSRSCTSISDCTVYNEDDSNSVNMAENISNLADRNMIHADIYGDLAKFNSEKLEIHSNCADHLNTRSVLGSNLKREEVEITGNCQLKTNNKPNVFQHSSLSGSMNSDKFSTSENNFVKSVVQSDEINTETRTGILDQSNSTSVLYKSEKLRDTAVQDSILSVPKHEVSDIKSTAKGKPSKKPKQTKKAQPKKKISRATKKSSVNNLNSPLFPQAQTPLHNPLIAQVIYSPISMPSENLPNEPASPYLNSMWQQQIGYIHQPQTFSPSYHGINYSENRQQQYQRPYLDYSTGMMPTHSNNPGGLQVQTSHPYGYSHQQQQQNIFSQSPSVNPQVPINHSYQPHMIDFLASPKHHSSAAIAYNDYHHSPAREYQLNFTNQNLSSPNSNVPQPFPSVSNLQHSASFHGSHLVPGAGQVLASPGNLSTICLADIAEDNTTNTLSSDSSRYVAKPRRKTNHNVKETKQTESVNQNIQNFCQNQSNNHMQQLNNTKKNTGIMPSYAIPATNSNNFCNIAPSVQNLTSIQGCVNNSVPGPLWHQPDGNDNYRNMQIDPMSNHHADTCVYNSEQTGDMKIRIRKLPAPVHVEQKSNLTHYWNVRKAGECRLVFSSNVLGKRKAEEETPGWEDYVLPFQPPYPGLEDSDQQQSKRRRCLVF